MHVIALLAFFWNCGCHLE